MDPEHVGRPDLIQSVSRALHILDELGGTPAGLNAKEVARRCGLALPTAYHLLRTLCYEGYAVRRPGGSYVLGLKVATHSKHVLAAIRKPPNVHEVLRQFAEVTGHSAYFGQVVDGRVVFTDLFEGPHSPHVEDLVAGFDEGAHATALGKALLSTMPLKARCEYLREEGLRPFTRNTVVEIDELNAELSTSSWLRVFTDHQQFRDNVCCAAAVVPRVGAIAVTSGSDRWASHGSELIHELRLRVGDLGRGRGGAVAHD
jgi:DNA-binding IclR family transcriptional regulator